MGRDLERYSDLIVILELTPRFVTQVAKYLTDTNIYIIICSRIYLFLALECLSIFPFKFGYVSLNLPDTLIGRDNNSPFSFNASELIAK